MLFINTRTHVNLSERCHYGHRCPRLEETLIVYEERIAFATIFRQRSSCSVDVEVGFAERRELEIACRRHLIALIDVGMDVYVVGDEPPRMGGQVILSMPGAPCMTCLGFLNEATLAREAGAYGDAGPRPPGSLVERRPGLHRHWNRSRFADRLDACRVPRAAQST